MFIHDQHAKSQAYASDSCRLEKDIRISYFWTRLIKLICVRTLMAPFYAEFIDKLS